jgi:chromosome partitioning protein
MQVLAILAQKGGVGKSMLARSLAVQALIEGQKAAIIDADPQGTVIAWGRRRTFPAPAVLPLGSRTIPDAVAELKTRGAEFVVIDTPPHAQPIINLAAKAASTALLVTGPYPEDLEQVGVVAGIVQVLSIPAGIILNKTPAKAHALTLARAALAAFRLPICPTAITQLVSHPYASAEGLTAQEREPDSRATAELADAWAWLKEGLLASKDTRIAVPAGGQ